MTEVSETTRTAITVFTARTDKMKEKEALVVHDEGFFQHDTGDTYSGYFEAKKKDRVVKMQGYGVYTTAEGDRYQGYWDQDRLGWTEEVVISYVDGAKYEGTLKDFCYYGRGKYTYPDGSYLECDFIDNCPLGNLRLTDPNGHTWLGKAEQGFAWFEPVNHFYNFLETTSATKTKHRSHKNLHGSSSPISKSRSLLRARNKLGSSLSHQNISMRKE